MENKEHKTKKTLNSRFSTIIFLLRLAGIPFKMKKLSIIYTIYTITVLFCTCTTLLGMFAEVYIQSNDLEHIMKNIRMLVPTANNWWIYAYARYVKTRVETLLASQISV
jgi:hypothetical protein